MAFACWGRANRSTLVRVPQFSPGKTSSARIEYRAVDAGVFERCARRVVGGATYVLFLKVFVLFVAAPAAGTDAVDFRRSRRIPGVASDRDPVRKGGGTRFF